MSTDFINEDDYPSVEESDPASDSSQKISVEDNEDSEPVDKSIEEELESEDGGEGEGEAEAEAEAEAEDEVEAQVDVEEGEDESSTKKRRLIMDDDEDEGDEHREDKEEEEIEANKEDNEPESIGDGLESEDDGEKAQDGRVKKKRRLIVEDDEEDEDGEKGENEESKEDNEVNEDNEPVGKSIVDELESEDEGEKEGEEDGNERSKKKRRLIVEDDEDDEDGEKEDNEDKEDKEDDDLLEKSNEAEEEGDGEGDGEGDVEGDGEGDGEEISEISKIKDPAIPDLSSDEESDDGKRRSKVPDDFVYDFDLMMARKKEESYRSRKRKNIDIINDNDDIIADLITQMKQSADEDFELNKNRKAATCKLRLLPVVETQLRKIDLRESFLDAGVLGVITDWLTPLPDRSLPNLQVRETMLKLLGEFNIMDVERLKASGIGKAVMYLYKHPKETKDNKKRAGVLISSWSRPIFSTDTDFHSMSKEEREQRDFDHMTKLSENKRGRTEPKTPPSSSRKGQPEAEKTLRPGDKGWIPRARVPAPSTRDYVVRPKSTVDSEMSKSGSKKAITRLDKHLRNFREKKKLMKTQRAVPISIEGRRMTL